MEIQTHKKIDPKDFQILELLSQGCRSKDIAEEICLSERTIEARIQKMQQRFDCRNSVQLVATAIMHELIGKKGRSEYIQLTNKILRHFDINSPAKPSLSQLKAIDKILTHD